MLGALASPWIVVTTLAFPALSFMSKYAIVSRCRIAPAGVRLRMSVTRSNTSYANVCLWRFAPFGMPKNNACVVR